MVVVTSAEPCLCSTYVIEDNLNHDDVVGLKLSYTFEGFLFTVLISLDFGDKAVSNIKDLSESVLGSLMSRFNKACIWLESDVTVEDIDKRLDLLWQEAEDLVREVAYDTIRFLADQHKPHAIESDFSSEFPSNLAEYLLPKSFNIQLYEDAGMVYATDNSDLPPSSRFEAEPMIAPKQELIRMKPENITILNWYRPHVLKVKTAVGVFCCKLRNTGTQCSFLREYNALEQLRLYKTHPDFKVPALRGVVEVEDGIIGLLIEMIESKKADLWTVLKCENDITSSTKQKWADQISHTLKQIHSIGLIWGDAKTANILIDEDDNAWLIDFGGGFTRGWVDETLYDTQTGDLQGLRYTIQDILGER